MIYKVYICPRCQAMALPTGEEQEHGPPECSHGLFFGLDPSGGGECEMVEVEVVRVDELLYARPEGTPW
jgi:DNA-directed RNA polymerase subunit RPC12/RpoP